MAGNKPWLFQKGVSKTQAVKDKISLSKLGSKQTIEHISNWVKSRRKNGWFKNVNEFRKKNSMAKKGIKLSESHKQNIGQAKKGITTRSGYHLSEEHRRKIGEAQKGEKGSNWKGGVTTLNHFLRNSLDMNLWRERIFKRDSFTCKWCKQRGGKLIADHVKMFAFHPKLRFDTTNGRTLCENCHAWKTKWDMKIYTGKVPELNIIYG